MRAFVFPGQGGGVSDAPPELLSRIQAVTGDVVPDQVKLFAHAARDTDAAREMGVTPDIVAGHSLGEYGAVYAAGCFDFETGVRLVAQRDRFLAEVATEVPGAMVAVVRANPDDVEEQLGIGSDSFVANYNSPKQAVVSGPRDGISEAMERVKVGRKIPLNVAFAAHSPYVAPASEKMSAALDEVEFRDPECPIVSAMEGTVLEDAAAVREALRAQMISPVRWTKVVATLTGMGVTDWIELGGGNVLTKLLRDFDEPKPEGITFADFEANR